MRSTASVSSAHSQIGDAAPSAKRKSVQPPTVGTRPPGLPRATNAF